MRTVSRSSAIAVEKLRLTLDLYLAGEEMFRARIRRRFPAASEAEIERRIQEWLRDRPGAENGDGVGRPVSWPRPRK